MSNEATRKVGEKNGKGDVPTCLFLQKVGSWPKQLFFVPCFFFGFWKCLSLPFLQIILHPCRDLQRSNVSASNPRPRFNLWGGNQGRKPTRDFFCEISRIHGFFVGGLFFKQNVDGRLKKENWNNQPMRCHFLMPTFFGIKFISTWAPCFMERKNLTYDAKGPGTYILWLEQRHQVYKWFHLIVFGFS